MMNIKKTLKEKCIKIWGERFINNFGLYMVISSTYNSHWMIALFNNALIIYYAYMFGYTLYYTLFVDLDIGVAAEAAHFTLIFVVCIIFLLAYQIPKSRWDQAYKSLTLVSYKYSDTIDAETAKEINILTESTAKRKKLLCHSVGALYYFFGFSSVFLLPALSGRYSTADKDDGINRHAPLIKWTPYDAKHSSSGWIISAICDATIVICVVSLLNAIDLPFICFSEEGCNQLDILTVSIRRVFRRARYVYEKKYGYPVMSYQEYRFAKCIKECMNDSVKHHAATVRYFNNVTRAYSWPVLIVIISGALLLCIAGIIFASKRFPLGMKVAFMFYLFGEFVHTYFFAHYGERMSQTSSGLRDVVYEVEWEECSKVLLPYVLIMQAYCNTSKIKLSAVGFMDYNLDNFGNVLRTAYSYFNLLSVSTDI